MALHTKAKTMLSDSASQLHMIDILRRKRDGGALSAREIEFVAKGAADGSIPEAELAAWLMAAWIRGLSPEETRALTLATQARSFGRRISANAQSISTLRAASATRRVFC
jgi:thymidine phosphorylase